MLALGIGVVLVGHVISIVTPNWYFVSFPNNNGTDNVKAHAGYFQLCTINGLGKKLCEPSGGFDGKCYFQYNSKNFY